MFYATLTAALADIATRSFHEGATVTPALSHCGGAVAYQSDSDGQEWFCPSCRRVSLPCSLTEGYAVTDDADPLSGDYLVDYGDGIEWPPNALDHSREDGPAKHHTTAAHVEYSLPAAIAALEDGSPVSFHYHAVSTACEITDPDYTGYGSSITGWALVAYGSKPCPRSFSSLRFSVAH